eukprot:6058392-Prymnesium_polylepis.1
MREGTRVMKPHNPTRAGAGQGRPPRRAGCCLLFAGLAPRALRPSVDRVRVRCGGRLALGGRSRAAAPGRAARGQPTEAPRAMRGGRERGARRLRSTLSHHNWSGGASDFVQ